MNNRFKFRCFNLKTKKMYEVDSLHLDNKEGEWVWVHYYNPIYDKDLKIQIVHPHAVLMQCTGLKDKNGKLIYEGDVVKKYTFIDYNGNGYQPDVYLDRVDIGVVHFTASNGVVLRKVKTSLTDNPYEEKKIMPKQDQPKAVKLFACRSEILGNIYENPELLESN